MCPIAPSANPGRWVARPEREMDRVRDMTACTERHFAALTSDLAGERPEGMSKGGAA
ncbi:hypothetical protein GCM10010168_32510 [Actinoplanes ianthinogenes]|uniref:Uncharacterized protein n=1 Tax=Actinoplanes ianthinogenes TaxID=122358 RepID=A0ABM7LM92_9ACTN|nr:hypothetical protein Aiant_10480 [Actinoplanes ianthinogenes]GGR11906.1 hypothetical protein GCM10010168_32510 [Actinoplanes ianthinogenes]